MAQRQVRRSVVDDVPVVWIEPDGPAKTLALWLTHLAGSKDQTLPVLRRLAGAGCVAMSFDPWRHGERGEEGAEQIFERVFGDFRRQMWPILGQTTLDGLRVLDWALAEIAPGARVVAGGVSMGGDVSVALAGVDERVERVAALIATPDWTRPDMRDLHTGRPIEQGEPDAYARWFYDQLDPMTHVSRYRRALAITFEVGGEDNHVPAEHAQRFRAAVLAQPSTRATVRINVHPGASHLDATDDSPFVANAIDWLTAENEKTLT
ncbi:MAG: alpha/beta hydrolase [Sciscionella sp.]|nr:alpha/beta hydrolase [Sciscionella sp.]